MDRKEAGPLDKLAKNFQVGLITSVLTQPFEVLRTSSISSYKSVKKFIGFKELWRLSKKIYRSQGPLGFFRGCGLSILKNGVSCTIFFTGLQNIDKEFKKRVPKRWTHQSPKTVKDVLIKGGLSFLNAGISKVITTCVVSPIILLKTRFQVAGKQRKSLPHQVKTIYKSSGVLGFYKGLIPTLLRDVPWSGFQYSFYTLLTMLVASLDPNLNKQLVAPIIGGISSIAAVCITFPFDNLRVRIQIQESLNKSISQIARLTFSEQGLGGLYKGLLPRLLKKGFSGAVLWFIYQNVWVDGSPTSK